MAYTPINWQNGDTITAEKMNKMDNGWGLQKTQLFSETVTTVSDGALYYAQLAYSDRINVDQLIVVFDNVEYTPPHVKNDMGDIYGEAGAQGPVFTNYPFLILCQHGFGTDEIYFSELYTEAGGSHTISVYATSFETSASFQAAVRSVIGGPVNQPMLCVPGETTYEEMAEAVLQKRLLYFYNSTIAHIITNFSYNASATAVNAVPEGRVNYETYGFKDVNGILVFDIFVY